LTAEGLVVDGDSDFRKGVPELDIEPRRSVLAGRGVSVGDVANTLNAAVAGVRQSRFTADGRRYDIRVKVPDKKSTIAKRLKKSMCAINSGIWFRWDNWLI